MISWNGQEAGRRQVELVEDALNSFLCLLVLFFQTPIRNVSRKANEVDRPRFQHVVEGCRESIIEDSMTFGAGTLDECAPFRIGERSRCSLVKVREV
jgi:hypothetical protein